MADTAPDFDLKLTMSACVQIGESSALKQNDVSVDSWNRFPVQTKWGQGRVWKCWFRSKRLRLKISRTYTRTQALSSLMERGRRIPTRQSLFRAC
jgi:hypothetical protein